MSPSQPPDATTRIMETIARRQVTPRSRLSVVGEYSAWATLLGSSILTLIVGANIIFAWLVATPSLRYLRFGAAGWPAFWDGAPLLWLALALTGVIVSALALKHYDVSYKIPFPLLVGGIAVGSLLIGLAFAQVGLIAPGYRPLPPAKFRAMHRAGLLPPRGMGMHQIGRHGLIGTVVEIRSEDGYLVESTGRHVLVITSNGTRYLTTKPAAGADIRAIGRFEGTDRFTAVGIEVFE